MRSTIVDFPAPDAPTMAIVFPFGMSRLTSSRIILCPSGYLKETFLNEILSLKPLMTFG